MRLERDYQPKLIKKIQARFPGCYVLKNDSGYMQGVPDLIILFGERWALLEVKRKRPIRPEDFEPNQEWYLEEFNNMSFAACVFPENEEEVLDALQQALQPRRYARVSQR